MIKNYTKLLLAVFFLICFTGFSQTNLISNGDFENWTGNQLDDWTFNNRAPIRVQNDFSSGSNSIEMWNISSSPISMSIVNQNTNLEAGKLYVIIIDSKTTTSGGTGNSKGYSYNLKINNGVATSPLIERQEWETSQQTFTAIGNGSDIIELSINSYSGGMLNVLIDNIRIFDVEQLNQNTSDKAALIAFHNSTGGPNWKNTWDINSDMNFWYGIKVDLAGRVTEINLKSNNLQGTLPAELGNLTELKKLELNRDFQYLEEVNNLNGAIPSTFQNLKKLEVLNLSNSGLTGSIPSEIGEMTALKELILSLNNFSGTIPPSLGNLSNLKNFNANYTTLSGNIPSELGLLTNLENLNLTGNQLSGSIPSSLGQLINLKELALSGNELTGAIPTSLNQLAQLEKLILAQNELSSTISESISQLSNLKELNLSSNNLVGPIPVQLSQLSQLESLYLDRNNLTGNIPKELGLLINLQRLSLVDINLTGTIPPELANLTNLERLYLGSNNLDGEIPSNFSQLTNLIEFSLYFNNLSGTVPSVSNNNIYYGLQANNFVFEDFPSNTNNQASTRYSPQSKVGEISITTLVEGGTFNLEVTETTHDNNTYQWRKDGVDISGAISSNLTIENIKPTDAGDYDCIIKNTLLTELTLEKEPITLNVLSNDDDNDGVINSNDQCPNTPSGNTVDSQGCIVSNNNQVNYAQNFSFENWSTNPATPEDWTIENENSIIQSTDATDGSSSLELDLDNSLQFKTELINTTSIQLATNTTYTYAFDYKIKRGTDVSAEIHISKDGNPYGIPLLREYTTFNTDGNWHTFSFDFDTNATDESHIFRLIFRANTTETGIIILDNLRILGDPLPDADNDGVLDYNDLCPNTSDTALAVDDDGCEVTIDGSNLLEDPSFEDWSYGGGANLAKWGIYIQLGSWVKNTDISDNLQYSVELITGGASSNSIFQNELQFYKDVEYIISIDYKVLEGTFTTLQLELTEGGIFGDIVAEFSTTPSSSGWQTFSTTFTPTSNEMLDLGIRVESGQTGDRILLDNTVIRANVTAVGDDDNDGIINTNDNCPNTPAGDTVDENGCTVITIPDSDNDGVANADDDCPNTPTGDTVDENGCTVTTVTDSDNDGVADADDDCPNTPTGDTVDENGCTVTIISDSDNDGVADADDDCPNTPTGDTVDANGCTITTDTDSDNDGVADIDDDCPNTPLGDTVDANGCTITTDTDSDNDGVADTDDDCPDTPEGETVDTNGCTIFENTLPNIPNDGIQVKVTSTSCPNTANGEISVSFTEDYNYTVQITGMLLDNTFDNINASNGLVKSDLSSGSYTVCVTIPEYPSYEQCYTVTIETPEEFISGKTVIDYTAKKASVVVSGSKNYEVLVNDKVYTFEVDHIDNQQLSFPLDKGANVISIETDKICQGIYYENVVISNAILTPNPVADILRVEGLNIMTEAQIIVSNVSGVTTLQESRQISNGTLEMNISNLSPGIYMLTIIDGDKEINLKFVKK